MRFVTKLAIALVGWNFLPPADAPAAPRAHHRLETRAALVSGEINSHVTQGNIQATICVSGWTKTIRPPASYTSRLKLRQMRQFGLTGDAHHFEEDHLISLEVGGNPRSEKNLWPQPWTGARNARQKDQLENVIHRLVCSHRTTLAQGRRELSKNWVAAYRNRIGEMR